MDNNIWANIETGNKEAYSEAYIFYYKKLMNYGKKITNDTAMIEDTIDEVFIMIWTKREKLHTILSPPSYIFSSYQFKVNRDYLNAIPLNQIVLNPQLTQNPGW